MLKRRLLLFLLSLPLLVRSAFAVTVTGVAAGASATMVGPLGLLIDLGIQNVPGVTLIQARLYYNIISFALVIWIAFVSDERTSAQFCIIATGIAAFTAFAGWFTTPNPVGNWGLIVMCALLSVVMYITEKKRISFGTSGGGDPLVNIVVFILLFQSTIGLVNGAGIFQPGNMVATPSECANGVYTACQINGNLQLTNINTNTGTGGILGLVFSVFTTLATVGWNAIVLLIQLVVSVAFFSAVILVTYPWISDSPQALLLVGIFQVAVWFIYMLTIVRYFWKPYGTDARL